MAFQIEKAAVLGAGTMGAQIAAHLANVGIPTLLLDVVPVAPALQKLTRLKPSPLYTSAALNLITPGNLAEDMHKLAEVDFIIEAVIEDLEVKQNLWQTVARHRRPGTIAASNTSGISIAQMAAGTPADFRRHFLGCHFFNPPRYMKLLELIPTADTDPDVITFMEAFGERVLGKGVVRAKDTPNFIGNRIGVYGLLTTLKAMEQLGLNPGEVDAITGPAMGRPKSATFRTLDIVGIDTFVHVADNCRAAIPNPEEAALFTVPRPLREMVSRGWLGQKTGQGFFKKDGGQILTIDLATMTYSPGVRSTFPSLEQTKTIADIPERLRALVYAKDTAGQFAWEIMKQTLVYCAEKLGEIADDILAIDNAMKWGYNWQLGPFAAWDAIGVQTSIDRMQSEGVSVPAFAAAAAKQGGFYRRQPAQTFYLSSGGDYAPTPEAGRALSVENFRKQNQTVKSRPGASLLNMGDDVLLLALHSPKSAIGHDVILTIRDAVHALETGPWAGLVIGSDDENFSVGANLMLVLMAAQDEEWDEVEQMARQFQNATMALKYAPRPVVAAPAGLTLGGGFEIALGADRIVAAAESYIGLVEVAVGLVPSGGGIKEMLLRALPPALPGLDTQPIVNQVFETIGLAKVSTSGPEARSLGYLTAGDRIAVNRDHRLYAAKQLVLEMDRAGYRRPLPARVPVAGPTGRAVLELGLYNMLLSGYASEYDCHIGKKLAFALTGGNAPGSNAPGGTVVSEQYLLDLEREAFLSLAGEKKTQDRMQHMLRTGKPLRN